MFAGSGFPSPGTLREVFDLAEVMLQSPLDISRPLWTATLVEGLEDGRAATLLHLSHAVTDGVGATAMFAEIYDLEREATTAGPPRRCRCPQDLTAERPDARRLQPAARVRSSAACSARSPGVCRCWDAWCAIRRQRCSARSTTRGRAAAWCGPCRRALAAAARAAACPSRSEAIEMRLGDLHRAAKAAGGSINDAYLAGLCGALRLYHEALGVPIDDPADGGAGEPAGRGRPGRRQPVRRGEPRCARSVSPTRPSGSRSIRKQMTSRREEAAIDVIGVGRAGAEPAARRGAGGDERIGDRLRRAGQQCAGLSR